MILTMDHPGSCSSKTETKESKPMREEFKLELPPRKGSFVKVGIDFMTHIANLPSETQKKVLAEGKEKLIKTLDVLLVELLDMASFAQNTINYLEQEEEEEDNNDDKASYGGGGGGSDARAHGAA